MASPSTTGALHMSTHHPGVRFGRNSRALAHLPIRLALSAVLALALHSAPTFAETPAVATDQASSAADTGECAATVGQAVATRLGYLPAAMPDSDSPQIICKRAPDAAGASLVAVVARSADNPPGAEQPRFDLDLMIVDTNSGGIRSRLLQPHAFQSGTMRFGGLSFDTAPYRLAPGVRAFGLRAFFNNLRMDTQTLSLYVAEGTGIRRVTGGIAMQSSRGIACQDRNIDSTVALTTSAHHGYSDFVVRSVTTDSTTDNGQCNGTESVRNCIEGQVFAYDGSLYRQVTTTVVPAQPQPVETLVAAANAPAP
jgi:hypothetical protein